MNQPSFFYCYNKRLSDFISTKGVQYIHVAQEPKSGKLYSLYLINEELQSAIDEYKQFN
ncbi:hypothetical protein [Rossellomorea sp. BNER]|uniref:hypothetical protein n=1 Tax=Rossellomorea sp. BNER TaxID=2962031 RepID=UPI003AF2078C|nr:hypothetical protein [Rossellomorea sp. BNER]